MCGVESVTLRTAVSTWKIDVGMTPFSSNVCYPNAGNLVVYLNTLIVCRLFILNRHCYRSWCDCPCWPYRTEGRCAHSARFQFALIRCHESPRFCNRHAYRYLTARDRRPALSAFRSRELANVGRLRVVFPSLGCLPFHQVQLSHPGARTVYLQIPAGRRDSRISRSESSLCGETTQGIFRLPLCGTFRWTCAETLPTAAISVTTRHVAAKITFRFVMHPSLPDCSHCEPRKVHKQYLM